MSVFFHQIDLISRQSSENNSYSLIFMLIMFVLIFYFVIFRPQHKKNKEHKFLIESLSQGDEVLTTSGFLGKIKKVTKNGYILLQLNDTTEVFIKRDFIELSLPKGTLKNL